MPTNTGGAALVIGVDSLVGAEVAHAFKSAGVRAFGTTRRMQTVGAQRLHLDLADTERFVCPPEVDVAIIAAALMPYSRCETDANAEQVNIIGPARLAARLAARGVFCVFLSSNTVFGGERPFCGEEEPLSPGFAYAAQKAQAERALRVALDETPHSYCVVRLTKVLAPSVPPLPDWHRRLTAGEAIQPFSDLVFAPMSRQFVAASLRRIAAARVSGYFHLSGEDNVSYADFAQALVAAMGLPAERVQPTTAAAAGVKTPFQPRFSALAMPRTGRELGITAQTLDAVVEDLLG